MIRRTLVFSIGILTTAGLLRAADPDAPDDTLTATTQPADAVDVADTARSSRGPMSIDELSLQLGVDGEYQSRTVRTDAAGFGRPRYAQDNRQRRLEETLSLDSRGNIVNDKVLLYDAMARFGLSQEHYVETRPGRNLHTDPDGTILEYDLDFSLLPAGKISADVYASQLDDRIPRPFLPSLDRRRERYGTTLHYNDPKLPMELSYEHLFDDVGSGSRYLYDEEERGEDRLRYEVTWQPTEHHSLRAEYEHERRSEQYSGTVTRFDTIRDYLALDHVLQFGPEHQSRLDTLLRLEEESGDLPRDAFEISPRLRWQHRKNLFTTWGAQFLKESQFDLDTQTLRGDWGVTHEFKERLTSSLSAYALRQDGNDGIDQTEWGGLADFSYNQKNRLGLFSSQLSYLHSQTGTDSRRNLGLIANESVTFRDPLPAYLAQRNIDPRSIVVTDPQRTRLFLPVRDYLVIPGRDVTALVRVPTGQIVDRQTVNVSYIHESPYDFDVTRDRLDLRLKQKIGKYLETWYALSWQGEDLDSPRAYSLRERDVNRHRLGATWRKPRWSSGVEYEYNDDSIDPYQAAHVNGDVALLQNTRRQLDGRATLSHFCFDGQDDLQSRNTSLLDLGLSYRHTLNSALETVADATYRFQHDSLFGETNGVDLTASLNYRVGLFVLMLEAEYDMLDLPGSTDHSMAVWIKVRRDIPVIARGVRQ